MAEIEVTAAMREMACSVLKDGETARVSIIGLIPDIYRAMRALEPANVPDPIRDTAMEYAVRCAPSRADLIPLARAIEAYLRGEGEPNEPKPPMSLRELAERALQRKAERDKAMSPPLPAA